MAARLIVFKPEVFVYHPCELEQVSVLPKGSVSGEWVAIGFISAPYTKWKN